MYICIYNTYIYIYMYYEVQSYSCICAYYTYIYIYIYTYFPKKGPMKHHHCSSVAKSSIFFSLQGRYFVALSLEEGQHLRAAIHRLSLDQAGVFFHHADPMLN